MLLFLVSHARSSKVKQIFFSNEAKKIKMNDCSLNEAARGVLQDSALCVHDLRPKDALVLEEWAELLFMLEMQVL